MFNSARTLSELHERISAALRSVAGLSSWELVLVNDGSGDSSWARIVELSEEHPEVRGVDLAGNFGQHNALLAGIHAARHAVIVTLDDDLQNPPEEIPRLLAALGPDLDVVYGTPIAKSQRAYRRIGAAAVRSFMRALTRNPAVSYSSGFRAFRAELTEQVPEDSGRRLVLDPLLRARTDRFDSVAVRHEPRRVGSSGYSPLTLARFALTEIATGLRLRGSKARRGSSYGVVAVTESDSGGDGHR